MDRQSSRHAPWHLSTYLRSGRRMAARVMRAWMVTTCFSATAMAVKVHVTGRSTIEARVVAGVAGVELRGLLRDDAGRPIPDATLTATLSVTGAVTVPATEPCGGPAQGVTRDLGRGHYELVADATGGFCLRIAQSGVVGKLALAYAGDAHHLPVAAALDVEPTRRSLRLSFSPEPTSLPLDRATQSIWVEVRRESGEQAELDEGPVQLALRLDDPDGASRTLARTTARPGERAELTVNGADLGEPGPATLHATFAGAPSLQAAECAAVVQRTAKVTLSVVGKPERGDPARGLELHVAVAWARGAVPGGSIEATLGRDSVGTATVKGGAANVIGVFEVAREGDVPISLSYLPAAPWWLAPEPLLVMAPVAPPSPWRRVPWVLAALVVGAWIARTWLRPPRSERSGEEDAVREPPGRESLDAIEIGPPRSGWKGRVLDAHEGTPIADATLALVVPTFGVQGVAATTRSDETGRFLLSHVREALVEGARLEVSARWHSTLSRPVPPEGTVAINLALRRRALLTRLVEWAQRAGRPWSGAGDPTPAHVSRLADQRAQRDVAQWAAAIERAAYGPEPPGEAEERTIATKEPRGVDRGDGR